MTCAKQTVLCLLLDINWNVISYGSNECKNPVEVCPREDLETGIGYDLCRDVCKQVGHAEINAIRNITNGDVPYICIVIGHSWCCDNCLEVLTKNNISNLIIIKSIKIIKD
jgi:hypothetical protein